MQTLAFASAVVPNIIKISKPINESRQDGRTDGWMTCKLTSFSTVSQSYQDDGRMIIKVCSVAPCLRLRRCRLERGLNPGPLDQYQDKNKQITDKTYDESEMRTE